MEVDTVKWPEFVERPVRERYGSKRGLLNLLKARLGQVLGRYRRHGAVDFTRVQRLVFICSGNICRSPLGECYARARGVDAISFGLDTRGGDPADPRAVAFAAGLGIDMSEHRTSRVDQVTIEAGDLLLVMEPAQYDKLEQQARQRGWPESAQKALLPLFGKHPLPYLHDPYGASPAYFERCERLVVEAVDGLIDRMPRP